MTFTVEPDASFGEFGPINDISLKAWDFAGNKTAWQNWDLNFSSQLGAEPHPALAALVDLYFRPRRPRPGDQSVSGARRLPAGDGPAGS